MPGLSRDLVEHRLPIKTGLDLISYRLSISIILFMTELKLKLIVYLMLDLFGLVVMLIGSLILYPLRRKIQGKLECALILEILIKLLLRMNILCL